MTTIAISIFTNQNHDGIHWWVDREGWEAGASYFTDNGQLEIYPHIFSDGSVLYWREDDKWFLDCMEARKS